MSTTQENGQRKALEIKHGLSRAIFTKYLGPTERRPSRIKAYDTEGFSAFVAKSEVIRSVRRFNRWNFLEKQEAPCA